jgi:transcriptional/translational regulatory protein YebC/TACO1
VAKYRSSGGGSAAWAFDRRGIVVLDKAAATEDQLMEIAVGAGADAYADDERRG